MRNLTLSPDSSYGGGKVKSKAELSLGGGLGREASFSFFLFRKVIEGGWGSIGNIPG